MDASDPPAPQPAVEEFDNRAALQADLGLGSLFGVKGKVVLVTGGGSGVGFMIAAGFVRNGCRVHIACRHDRSAHAAELTQAGPGSCTYWLCDVCDTEQLKSLLARIEEAEGKLHVLVNNSAVQKSAPLGEHTGEMFEEVIRVNTIAAYSLTRLAAPLLEASSSPEDPGRVINVSSVAALRVYAGGHFGYTASKAALGMLSKQLACALAPKHVTVNTICLGPFMTKMTRASIEEIGMDRLCASIPRGRLGEPSDVAGVCLFLSSRAGAYLTGTEIAIDGGALVGADL